MRIAFVISNFGTGGAERVASLLCSAWAGDGHEVTAVTFEPQGAKPAYPIAENVGLLQIDALNTRTGLLSTPMTQLRRFSRLRRVFKQLAPDVIVAFTTEANVAAIWAASGLDTPVVVSERNQPGRPGLGRMRRAARRLTYPNASAIVVQTEGIAQWVRRRFRVPLHVIPNPVRLRDWETAAGQACWRQTSGRRWASHPAEGIRSPDRQLRNTVRQASGVETSHLRGGS